MANDSGTLVFGAHNLTLPGHVGTASIHNDFGFYDISTTLTTNFRQFDNVSPYTSNYIQADFATAGAGTQLLVRVYYNDAAADNSIPSTLDNVDGTLQTTFVERAPSTANLVDTWGNPTFTITANTQI